MTTMMLMMTSFGRMRAAAAIVCYDREQVCELI